MPRHDYATDRVLLARSAIAIRLVELKEIAPIDALALAVWPTDRIADAERHLRPELIGHRIRDGRSRRRALRSRAA